MFSAQGALLFDLWFDVPFRPTKDIDLLGFGLAEEPHLHAAFAEMCGLDVDDGIHFDAQSVRIEEIRKEANYTGVRVSLLRWVDGARCPVQVDVGYGDAVTPGPDVVEYPVMLEEFPAPKLRVYPRYTVVAEKLEALISLGVANSRLKDYFDLWVLARNSDFESEMLQQAIEATLLRRGTGIPVDVPFGLTQAYAEDAQKQMQWQGFLKKNRLQALTLEQVVADLQRFLLPPLNALAAGQVFSGQWDRQVWDRMQSNELRP